MTDFDIIIDGVKANTEQVEEDIIRVRMGLKPKESEVDEDGTV